MNERTDGLKNGTSANAPLEVRGPDLDALDGVVAHRQQLLTHKTHTQKRRSKGGVSRAGARAYPSQPSFPVCVSIYLYLCICIHVYVSNIYLYIHVYVCTMYLYV